METLISKHWTAESIEDFTFRIASDFLAQVETKIEAGEINRTELAHRLNRTPGRVSQLFNNPGNLTVTSAVRLVRAAGMKVALVAYDDNDPQNNSGPVNSELFSRCWTYMGAPKTFFEFANTTASASVGNYFNAYTVNCNGPVAVSTVYANSGVFSYNANSPVTTLTGNPDVNWCYIPHHQGTGSAICETSNMGVVSDENGMGVIGKPVALKATTTTTKVTQECFIPMEA